jgi:GAF domain-containing protein
VTAAGEDDAGRLEQVTEELLSLYEEINVLYSVAEIAARSVDLAAAGRKILDEAVALLKADVGFIVYTNDDLRGEEPEPVGLAREACHVLAAVVALRLDREKRSYVSAPFVEGAAIARAPEAVVAAPLTAEGEVMGLLCLGRRGRGATFTSGDEKIVSVLAAQAGLVFTQRRNLDLTRMARGLEERTAALKGILEVGKEITSTLDAGRILRAVADLPARLLGFDRCGVLVEERGVLRLRALSGVTRVDREDATVGSLEDLLVWVSGRGEALAARSAGDSPSGEEEIITTDLASLSETPTAAQFRVRAAAHFEISPFRALIAIPLSDDQGTLGAIGLESSRSEALTEAAREAALIVAQQATVALRNARLYRDLPFVSMLEPMRRGRKRLASIPGRRLAAGAALAGAIVLASILIPWELRIPGTFVLQPGIRIEIVSRVRGVIREVSPVHEGDLVHAGDVIARLDDTDWRLRLGEAESKLQSAQRSAARMEAEGRAADLDLARLESERWASERDLLQSKIHDATVRAPADGTLLTPRLAERTGELLDVGSPLCTLAGREGMRAEIAVTESEADVLTGALPSTAVLKFQAFPERDVEARVLKIRPAAELIGGETSLVVEAAVSGSAQDLRPGMTGQARIAAGSRSLAFLALRRPYRYLRRSLWW